MFSRICLLWNVLCTWSCSWLGSVFPPTTSSDPKLNYFPNNSHIPNEVFVHAISSAWNTILIILLVKTLLSLWGSIQIPLPPWKFLNCQALLCGPHTSLKTHVSSFLHYGHLCINPYSLKGEKLCLTLLHRMKSKFLRITRFLGLGARFLLSLMSWHSLQWTWYQSCNINQLLGIPKPLRSQSLSSKAYEGVNCSLGFSWAPGVLHSHSTCNPAYHTSCFPLCFTWLPLIPIYTLVK